MKLLKTMVNPKIKRPKYGVKSIVLILLAVLVLTVGCSENISEDLYEYRTNAYCVDMDKNEICDIAESSNKAATPPKPIEKSYQELVNEQRLNLIDCSRVKMRSYGIDDGISCFIHIDRLCDNITRYNIEVRTFNECIDDLPVEERKINYRIETIEYVSTT